jgi:quercetin dioxygenase-like cupin family protein
MFIFPLQLDFRLNCTQGPGDLWFFPAGIPHSLQATDDLEEGAEFILVSISFTRDTIRKLTDISGFRLWGI